VLRFLGSMGTFMDQGRTNMEPRCHRGHRALNPCRMLYHHVHVTSAVPQAFLGRFSDEKLKFSKFSNLFLRNPDKNTPVSHMLVGIHVRV
jgi:hypothetical protein